MTPNKIKVLIADDHDLYRDGMRNLLSADNELEVCAEASDGEELVQLAGKHLPDVILTDLVMPKKDAIQAIQELYKTFTRETLKIAIISTFDSDTLVIRALEAGAIGYVSKTARREEIIDTVKTVYDDKPYYCTSTSSRMRDLIYSSSFNPYKNKEQPVFSDLEKNVIHFIIEEKSSGEICELLFQSKRTVDRLRSGILTKMKVKTPAGVAIYAVKNGLYLIEPPRRTT